MAIERPRHLAIWSLFEGLLFRNRSVHSPTRSSMKRAMDPSSSTAQSMCVCVCVCARVCGAEIQHIVERFHQSGMQTYSDVQSVLLSACHGENLGDGE